MKKLFVFSFILFTASLVFAGGSSSQQSSAVTAKSSGRIGARGSVPISDGSKTFTMIIPLNGNVTSFDYSDNLFTKRLVDDTGVKFEFITSPASDINAKLNALLSSGDYPDVIAANTLQKNRPLVEYYAREGIFIALDDYNYLEYPRIAKIFQDYPAAYDYFRLSDGKFHALPFVSESMHNMRNFGHASYYMPFVRDNNKKVPSTIDEMTEYLRWVRDNDVNKNGDKNDEIPLVFRADELKQLVGMLAKAYMPFVFTDDYFGLARNDSGKIVEQYKDPLFRESLKVLNNWYREGLIYEGSFSMTGDQLNSLVRNPTPVAAVMATAFGKYLAQSNTERWLEVFNAINPLKGPNGAQYGTITDPWFPFQFGWIITDKCSDPEMIIAAYDYCITDEMTLLTYYGPKGVGWTDPDPGTTAIRGGPAVYKPLISYGQGPINSCWSSSHANINNAKGFVQTAAQGSDYDTIKRWYDTGDPSLMPALIANASFNETMNYMIAIDNDRFKMPIEVFIPPVLMSNIDAARYSDIKASLDAYKDQAFTEFIIGRRNISNNSDWNTYLAELDRVGSSEMVGLIQKYVKE